MTRHVVYHCLVGGVSSVVQDGFLDRVQETFCCICCQELVFKPVTTVCSHNVCKVSI